MDKEVILERAFSLVNQYMFAVELQHKRIKAAEFKDWKSMCEWLSDFQFFILALCRLRKAAKITLQIPDVYDEMNDALNQFDKSIPNLTKLRNIGEHIDEYAIDNPRRYDKSVDRKQLQVESWDNMLYTSGLGFN